jgi:hypothetical protein
MKMSLNILRNTDRADKDEPNNFVVVCVFIDRFCGLVVRVLGYRSGSPDSIPGTTRKKK